MFTVKIKNSYLKFEFDYKNEQFPHWYLINTTLNITSKVRDQKLINFLNKLYNEFNNKTEIEINGLEMLIILSI